MHKYVGILTLKSASRQILCILLGTEWNGRTGRIDSELLKICLMEGEAGDQQAFDAPICYVCGPPQMTDAIAAMLSDLGVPKDFIIYEKWW